MLNVILTVHMIACIALVIAVMLQRSEGGALGMGGGGTGGVISGRGAASMLVRVTMVLAGIFFVTSIVMTRMNNDAANQQGILEREATQSEDPFDALRNAPPAPTAPDPLGGQVSPDPSGGAPALNPAPAPSTAPDPLAPSNSAPATPAPATPAPATTAPATTAPTEPSPTPESGGSNN